MPVEALVIQMAFLVALVIFVVSALIRRLRHPGGWAPAPAAGPLPPPLPPTLPPGSLSPDPSSPYAPPSEPSFYPQESEPEPLAGPLKVPVHWYRPRDLAGIAFFFVLYSGLQLSSASASSSVPAEQKYTAGVLIFSMFFQILCVGIAVALMIARVNPVKWLGLRWRSWPLCFAIAPLAVLVAWAFNGALALTGITNWLQEALDAQGMQESVQLLMKSQDGTVIFLMSFAACIVAPLAEETIFRGYLYPAAKRFCGPAGAIICSSLIFAAAHGSGVALLPLFALAVLLCLIYERTGSLWAPISVHFLFNSATVVVQLLIRSGVVPLPPGS